jgi:hypothetical protein
MRSYKIFNIKRYLSVDNKLIENNRCEICIKGKYFDNIFLKIYKLLIFIKILIKK